jgi:Flp pilus assembly protein TadB
MLSERERQQLNEIERWLAVDYPDLPRVMTRQRTSAWRRTVAAIMLVGLVATSVGALLAGAWPYIVAGLLIVTMAVIAGTVCQRARRRRRGRPHKPGAPA